MKYAFYIDLTSIQHQVLFCTGVQAATNTLHCTLHI